MSWLKRLFAIVKEHVAKDAPKEQSHDTSENASVQPMAARNPEPQEKPSASNKSRDSADIHAMRMERIKTGGSDAERLGIRYLYMHLSALSPNTRPSHAARHGHLYTEDEMQEWWGSDENDVECKCTAVMILVDEDGNPMTPSIIERARKTYDEAKAKAKGDWEWTRKEL